MLFEWDPEKDKANWAKYDVSFAEATELFKSGIDYWEIYDEQHSGEEDRFIAIGPIERGVIVVAYTERDDESPADHGRAHDDQERAPALLGIQEERT
jgi:uncharacterized DUF497 family protein